MRAHFISYLAQGSLERAFAFIDLKDGLLEKRKHILNAIYFKKFSLFRMEEFNLKDNTQRRKGVSLLLDILLSWFRDLLVIKSSLDTPLINMDKKEDLLRFAPKYTPGDLARNIATVANAKFLVNSDFNINVKLAISKMRADLWRQ